MFQAESEAEMMSWIESLLQIVCLITYEEQEMKKNADSTPQMKLFEGTLDYLTFFYMWSPRYVSIRAGVLYIFDVASKKRTGKYALYKSEVAPYISENKSYANSFQLTVNVGTSPEILYFKAKDKQELNQWINNINLQKKEIEHIIDSILQ